MLNGKRLKELRLSKDMTQDDLSKVIKVTKSSICCYENERRTPTLETLIDIIMFFGVSADYLIGNDKFVIINSKEEKKISMTEEEVKFIECLRKEKYLSEVLLEDPTRSIELLNKKIG